MAMLFLEAYETVYKNKVDEYMELSRATDAMVEETEPGMLIHVNTKVAETDTEIVFRWAETYADYESLQYHLTSPKVKEHLISMTEGKLLSKPVEVVIYCNWTDEQKAPFMGETPGAVIRFEPIGIGYFREYAANKV